MHEETLFTSEHLEVFRNKDSYFAKMVGNMDSDLAEQYECVVWDSDEIATACGNREIAVKQWKEAEITLNPPPGLGSKYPRANTVHAWTDELNATEYSYFYDMYHDAF